MRLPFDLRSGGAEVASGGRGLRCNRYTLKYRVVRSERCHSNLNALLDRCWGDYGTVGAGRGDRTDEPVPVLVDTLLTVAPMAGPFVVVTVMPLTTSEMLRNRVTARSVRYPRLIVKPLGPTDQ